MATRRSSTDLWMAQASASSHEGAMRARAKRLGLIEGDEPLSSSDMQAMLRKDRKAGNTRHMRQDVMAMNMQKRHRKG